MLFEIDVKYASGQINSGNENKKCIGVKIPTVLYYAVMA